MNHESSMALPGVADASIASLFATYSGIIKELRRREIVRTNNAPAGDYAEWLVWHALSAKGLEPNSVKSHDLVDATYGRVQVKARVTSTPAKSGQVQTSPFRSEDFDHAALVLFDIDTYSVTQAVLLPVEAVKEQWSWRPHVNGWIVQMNGPTMHHASAIDIANAMRHAATQHG